MSASARSPSCSNVLPGSVGTRSSSRWLHCSGCSTSLEGRFRWAGGRKLTREQWTFLEEFVRARGKIKDVEQALGVSYPTVVARLNDVVLGHGI